MRAISLLVMAGCATQASPALRLDAIDPSSGRSDVAVPVELSGVFHLAVTSSLDDHRATAAAVQVSIGGVALDGVQWTDEHSLAAMVPAGLAPGPHDVVVTIDDRSAMLPDGYVVIGDPAALVFVTAPAAAPACACSGAITVELADSAGQSVVTDTALPLAVTSDSPTLEAFADTGCTIPATGLAIAAGAGSADFYFLDATPGAPRITVTAARVAPASQLESVTAALSKWYRDLDGDGFGDPAVATYACSQPAGYVADHSDCDDDPAACGAGCFPGNPAPDVCDGRDQDCDGMIDEEPDIVWYADADGDGYGNAAVTTFACSQPTGYVSDHTDCDDDPAVCGAACNPGHAEGPPGDPVCSDTFDNDCDGLIDSADPGCGGYCLGANPYLVCIAAPPTGSVSFGTSGTINTDICSTFAGMTGVKIPQAGGPTLCVFAADTFAMTGQVTATGSLPLVILTGKDLKLQGSAVIDVSGNANGAGGNYAGCATSGIDGATNTSGGGGGAGGSFGTTGGAGASVASAGAGGTPAAAATPAFLRGGCPGGGGGGALLTGGGNAGSGGGAVYLVAGGKLSIDGKVNASGSGGGSAAALGRGGGGGGGSGGMIALYGKTSITISGGAQLWANGGGGAGGSNGLGHAGGNGTESTNPTTRGQGGTAGDNGATVGGVGAINSELGAPGGSGATQSGGGGGGGVGWIENVSGGTLGGQLSPPPS